ncbi:MAG: hypothetical protein ABI361_01730 [Nitrososphaera sp.]|jgi:hypothetical protein
MTKLKPYRRKVGKIIELSESKLGSRADAFGLVEIGELRLVGSIADPAIAKVGSPVRLVSCGVIDGMPYYKFSCIPNNT